MNVIDINWISLCEEHKFSIYFELMEEQNSIWLLSHAMAIDFISWLVWANAVPLKKAITTWWGYFQKHVICPLKKQTFSVNYGGIGEIKNNAWVTVNNDFLVTSGVICQWFSRVTKSRVKIIGKSPHEWPKNCYSRQRMYYFISYTLFYLEHTVQLQTIIDRSFRHCR